MALRCPICLGKHNTFEHFGHQAPRNVINKVTTPNLVTDNVRSVPNRPKKAVSTESPVTKSITKSDKDRVYAWRKKNRAKYNEKQKELMKKRAAKAEYIKTHLEMIGDIKEVMRKKRAK